MIARARRIGLVAGLILTATVAVGVRGWAEPRPSLAEIAGIAGSGRLDEAEEKLRFLMDREPADPGMNLLAAQFAMARSEPVTTSGIGPDPAPATRALEHLGRVVTGDARLAALAMLWRGKAERYLGRLEEAEASWLESLRLDPAVPESGWLILEEYYLQGRAEEARSLALRLHRAEPDRRDRVLLLLEPIRQEVMPPAPASLVLWFEPIAGRHPDALRANVALGLALVRSSEPDRGIEVLRKMVELHQGRRESWDALMSGLDEAGELGELATVVKSLPVEFSTAPWTLRYRARLDEDRGDWAAAACSYRRALEGSPADHRLAYRLARALRRGDDRAEADRLDKRHQARPAIDREARDLYENAIADKTLGITPRRDLFEKLACQRENSGFPEQARAWRRMAGVSDPRD